MKAVFWGFVGSLLIMVATIAWGYYSSTKELTVSKNSYDVVIGPSAEIDGISIYYNDNKISNLSKTVFSVENTGRVAIKSSDIVSPITIGIDGGVKVFDFILSGMEPENIDATLTRDKDRNIASVKFSLLNPGDKFNVSMLSDAVESPDISALARIDGIKNIVVKNKISENGVAYSILLWSCLILSSLSVLLSFVFFNDFRKECNVKSSIRSRSLKTPENSDDMRSWIDNIFDFYQDSEKKILLHALNNKLDETNEDKLELIENLSIGFVSNFGVGVMVLVLGAIGAWFSLNGLGVI